MNRRSLIKTAASFATGAVLAGTISKKTLASGARKSKMDALTVLRNRRSVRSFKSDAIPEEHLKEIIDIARLAPTAGNQQPWKFLIVKNKKSIQEFKESHLKNAIEGIKSRKPDITPEKFEKRITRYKEYLEGLFSAPVFVVVLTDNDSRNSSYNEHDGPLAALNLMLAARVFGYGTVYATDAINRDITRKFFNIPDKFTIVCTTPIGVPQEWPDMPKKKELSEFIINEKF